VVNGKANAPAFHQLLQIGSLGDNQGHFAVDRLIELVGQRHPDVCHVGIINRVHHIAFAIQGGGLPGVVEPPDPCSPVISPAQRLNFCRFRFKACNQQMHMALLRRFYQVAHLFLVAHSTNKAHGKIVGGVFLAIGGKGREIWNVWEIQHLALGDKVLKVGVIVALRGEDHQVGLFAVPDVRFL